MSALERTGLYMEGVYRKSGAAPRVKELKTALEAGSLLMTFLIVLVRTFTDFVYIVHAVTYICSVKYKLFFFQLKKKEL